MHANGRHFYRLIHALAPAVVLIASIVGTQSVYASDTYTTRAGGNLDWSPDSGAINQTASTELEATGALIGTLRFGFFGSEGTADYEIAAGAGVARVKLSGDFDVPSGDAYPFNPSVQAYSWTELTISGPAGNIATSVNVHVDGFLGIPVCAPPKDPDLCGALTVEIHAANHGFGSEFNSYGTGRVNDLGLVADPVPGGYHVHGDVALPLSIPANVPYGIELSLTLGGGLNGGPGVSTFAGDFDVAFARGGPVLNNIPAGYTVSGRGVVNNAWTDPFAPTSDDVVVTDCADPALAALTSVAGSLVISNIAECADISFANLKSVGGDLIIEGNNSLRHVAIPGPVIVDGSVNIINNDAATDITIDVGNGQIGGDLTLESATGSGGKLDLSSVSVTGNETVGSTGVDAFSGNTAGGVTDVTMLATTATMHVVVPQKAFDHEVGFTITRHTDPAQTGTADDGTVATINPIFGYEFAFDVPVLNADAQLSFTVDMSQLGAAEQANLLNALASGTATIVGKADDPGAVYSAFPVCAEFQTPADNQCVAIAYLAADGTPTQGAPAFVRFDGVVGHFSTYAVAIVSALGDATPPVVTVPAPITVDATSPHGATVTYAVSAHDDTDPSPALLCTPSSSTVFPIGATAVTCTARDASGNSASAGFTVDVLGVGAQIVDLINKTLAFLDQPLLRSTLQAQLQRVADAVAARNPTAQCLAMDLYIAAVRLAPTKAFAAAEKTALISDATRIKAVIGCR